MPPPYRTERLLLREWRPDDRAPFAALNADPEVMEHFPSRLTPSESDALADKIEAFLHERGFGLFAVGVVGGAPFIGFVGLSTPFFEAPFTPCVEVGWRLARAHWGKGYATEAAREVLRVGFEEHGFEEIVSMTAPVNTGSLNVMQKLGMHRDAEDDFDHPRVAQGHPLRRHVLYRLARAEHSRSSVR